MGPWLVVANEESGTLVLFAVGSDGALTRVGDPVHAIDGASTIEAAR